MSALVNMYILSKHKQHYICNSLPNVTFVIYVNYHTYTLHPIIYMRYIYIQLFGVLVLIFRRYLIMWDIILKMECFPCLPGARLKFVVAWGALFACLKLISVPCCTWKWKTASSIFVHRYWCQWYEELFLKRRRIYAKYL